jgi:hypothetical protein
VVEAEVEEETDFAKLVMKKLMPKAVKDQYQEIYNRQSRSARPRESIPLVGWPNSYLYDAVNGLRPFLHPSYQL